MYGQMKTEVSVVTSDEAEWEPRGMRKRLDRVRVSENLDVDRN